jgi:hypothetical protein
MVAFAVLQAAAVAGQFGWWYQWYFLSAPLVVLALRGLDDLAPRLVRGPDRGRAIAVLAVACLPMLAHAASWTVPALLDGGGLTAASRDRIDERVAGYDTIRAEIAAAGVRATDSLFVLGDPLYHLLAGKPLIVRTNGWDTTSWPTGSGGSWPPRSRPPDRPSCWSMTRPGAGSPTAAPTCCRAGAGLPAGPHRR